MPIKLFCCYARKDEALLLELRNHLLPLQREGLIEFWHDREILPGENWQKHIHKKLNNADLILLLVSPDFIASDYCYGIEMQRALERHANGECVVIPVILRPVYWHGEPLANLQALPTDGKPITGPDWHTQDSAFYDVVSGIHQVIQHLPSVSGLLPSLVKENEEREKRNSISPATKLILLTCRDLAAHLCDMASMTMVVFPYGDHRPAGRILDGRNEPRDIAVVGFERLTDGLRNQKDSGSKTKSLSDLAVEFYDMVKWDLDQIQAVLTPRLLGNTTDQKLIDALVEFDHANRTLYSAILGHKLVVTQSAYFHIPNLIAAAGHLYRAMQPHWERAERDLVKDNGLVDG